MSGFTERISLIIDAKTDQAAGAIKSFRTEVANADGFMGKMKAGVGSLGASLTSFINSPQGAAVAIGAVSTAAIKLVTDSAELGIEIGKLSDATGLSTEAASRWIEVGGDMGLGADKINGLIEKMVMNLGKTPEKFKEMGIEVVKGEDGLADMNATLLNAIKQIDGIKSPTEKAKVAASLFGKSWADASELVGMGADKVKQKLDAVGDAKIYDTQQVKDSRAFRDAMENMKDVGGDLAATIGKELVPAVTDLLQGVKKLADVANSLDDPFQKLTGGLSIFQGSIATFTDIVDEAGGATTSLSDRLKDDLHPALETARATTRNATDAAHDLTDAQYVEAESAADAARGAKALADMLKEQRDKALEAASSMWDVEEATLNASQKYADYTASLTDGKSTMTELRLAQIDQVQGLTDIAAKYAEEQGAAANSRAGIALQVSKLGELKDQFPLLADEIQKYIDKLNAIPHGINTNITAKIIGTAAGGLAGGQKFAAGAIVPSAMVATVGDAPGGEAVLNKPQVQDLINWAGTDGGSGGGNTYNVTVNGANMTPDELVAAIKKFERRNGPGWRA